MSENHFFLQNIEYNYNKNLILVFIYFFVVKYGLDIFSNWYYK